MGNVAGKNALCRHYTVAAQECEGFCEVRPWRREKGASGEEETAPACGREAGAAWLPRRREGMRERAVRRRPALNWARSAEPRATTNARRCPLLAWAGRNDKRNRSKHGHGAQQSTAQRGGHDYAPQAEHRQEKQRVAGGAGCRKIRHQSARSGAELRSRSTTDARRGSRETEERGRGAA